MFCHLLRMKLSSIVYQPGWWMSAQFDVVALDSTSFGVIIGSQRRRHCSRPRCDNGQYRLYRGSSRCDLPVGELLVTTAVDHQVALFRCTGVHHCAGWTTVIRCCLASLMTNSSDYKPSRTLQRAWCQELVVRTTSHQSCDSYNDSRSNSAWNTNWPPLWRTKLGLSTSHLAGDCQLVTATGRRRLRSSDIPPRVVQRTSTRVGDRCCRCAAARIWNRLPSSLRDPEVTYRRQFCGHLFCLGWDYDARGRFI